PREHHGAPEWHGQRPKGVGRVFELLKSLVTRRYSRLPAFRGVAGRGTPDAPTPTPATPIDPVGDLTSAQEIAQAEFLIARSPMKRTYGRFLAAILPHYRL